MSFLLLLGRVAKNILRLRELVTIISKQQVILRGFYATRPWALTLGLKCYYLCRELYHAWVLVITLVLSTDVARSTMGLVWINKIWAKTKTIQVQLLLYQSAHVCVRVYYDSLCQMLLRDLKTYPWCILYSQLLSRLYLIMLCLSKNLIPLLYINFSKIFENHGKTEILTQDEITCFHILWTRRKHWVAYIRHVSALRKYGDLVFHSLLQAFRSWGRRKKMLAETKNNNNNEGVG